MQTLLRFFFILLVIFFGLSFALLNPRPITLDYYFGLSTLPLSLALILSVMLGAALGLLAALRAVIQGKREVARLRRRLAQADKELRELRTMPTRDAI